MPGVTPTIIVSDPAEQVDALVALLNAKQEQVDSLSEALDMSQVRDFL